MMSRLSALLAAAIMASAPPAFAYDPAPWIDDARQIRAALGARYANIDWLTGDRALNLDANFKLLEGGLARVESDAEARAMLDRALGALADGHVRIDWSKPAGGPLVAAPTGPVKPCADARPMRSRPPVAAGLPGWRPLDAGEGAREFPGGRLSVEGREVGVVQIGLFEADQEVCQAAAARLGLPLDKPCDDDCSRRLDTAVYQLLTDRFGARLSAMKAAGVQVLMIDLAGNGGGREWAEVAARMVTPLRIRSAPVRYVRSPQAAEQLESLAVDIEANVQDEREPLKARLLAQAADLRARATEARRACDPAASVGAGKPCPLLIDAGYGAGVWAAADPVALADKAWGQSVFTPAKWTWSEGVWSGPLIVLVDARSASASEEFAAILQDNKAAIILGSPTLGAGCGHATSAGPITLKNSGGRLFLPDCLRLRADGSNEIGGIEPDVLVGFRNTDGPALKARRLAPRLPEAVARAVTLAGTRGR